MWLSTVPSMMWVSTVPMHGSGSSISCAAARRNTSTARADANVAKNMAVLVFEFYSAELLQLHRAGHMRLQVACNSELRASWLTPYPRSARYVVRKAKR